MKQYLITPEVAEMLRLSVGGLANLRYRGEGPPYIKRKRQILYDPDDIREYLENRRVRTEVTEAD